MSRPILPLLLACLVAAAPVSAQTFVSITDPNNPVIHDGVGSGGGAWEDLNGDGLLDLFVAYGNLNVANDGLFLNMGGMNFQKVVTGPVVTKGGSSIGGCWGDWDGDGLPDLWVTNRTANGNFLFHALGDTSFADVVTGDPITDRADANSSSWVDVDGDGDLDLYVVNFGTNDFFYLNSGAPSWTLTRTPVTGIGIGTENSINAVWGDFDNDGDLDIFIGNAGTQNDDLGINQGGLVFTRRVIPDGQSTLGASWGDYDDDGDLDLFAANFGTSILYRNDGGPLWNLTPVPTSVFPALTTNSIGSAWGDVDNDGDLDLLVSSNSGNEALFLNSGPPSYTFTQVTTGPLVNSGGASFGCSFADIDRDGDLDVFVANISNQNDFLFRNDGPTGHWLTLRLRGALPNRSAIGARVRLRAMVDGLPRWMTREVEPQSGYNSQNPELYFGLGADATVADSIDIRWPNGAHELYVNVAGDRYVEIVQGQAVGVAPGGRTASALAIRSISPNPGKGVLRVSFVLPCEGTAQIEMFDLVGRRIEARKLPSFSAGEQSVSLLPGNVAAGVYLVRLTQGNHTVSARTVLTR